MHVAPGPLPLTWTAGYKWSVVKVVRVVARRREQEGTFDERRGFETLRAPHYGRQKSAGDAPAACKEETVSVVGEQSIIFEVMFECTCLKCLKKLLFSFKNYSILILFLFNAAFFVEN